MAAIFTSTNLVLLYDRSYNMEGKIEMKGVFSLDALSKKIDTLTRLVNQIGNRQYEYTTINTEPNTVDMKIQALHKTHQGWEYVDAVLSRTSGSGATAESVSIVLRRPL